LIQNNEIDNTLDSRFCSVAGGVAVYIENAILFSSSNPGAVPLIIGNLIQDNTQAGHEDAGGIGGAGIAVFGETAVIEENVIRNNSTDAIGAAIHLETGSSSLIVGNVVYNNQSGGGGGALDYDSAYVDSGVYPTFNVFVANNTFVNNTYSGFLPNGFLNDNDVDQIYLRASGLVAPTAAFVNNIVAGDSPLPVVQCGLQRQSAPVDDTLDGAYGTGTLTLASLNGFSGTVALTCNPPLPSTISALSRPRPRASQPMAWRPPPSSSIQTSAPASRLQAHRVRPASSSAQSSRWHFLPSSAANAAALPRFSRSPS
jgi:hypothetical protein